MSTERERGVTIINDRKREREMFMTTFIFMFAYLFRLLKREENYDFFLNYYILIDILKRL